VNRRLVWVLVAIGWVAVTVPYALWCRSLAVAYWRGDAGASHDLIKALALTLPSSIILFIPMYLFAAAMYQGGTDLTVAHAMGSWFVAQAVFNSVLLLLVVVLIVRGVRGSRTKAAAPVDLVANPYATQT
jgi:hypothetical protein